MAQRVREIMSKNPVTMDQSRSVVDAARAMRQHGLGVVMVMDGSQFRGVVTDRDIVVRGVAEGNIGGLTIGSLCSPDVLALSPHDPVDRALRLMRERSLQHVAILDGGRPVGTVSLGDLAAERVPG
jgi:CBS domain-containing protein